MLIKEGQVAQADRDSHMVWPERPFQDLDAALAEPFGLGVSTFFLIEGREITERRGYGGMIWSEHLLEHGQAALIERLGVGVSTLVLVEKRQVV